MALLLAAAALFAAAQAGLPAASGAQQKTKVDDQQWRYTFHNGEWWYWLPENRWVYWRNNRWNDYNPQTFTYLNNSGPTFMLTGRVDSGYATQAVPNEEIRPYYGHAESQLDRRPLERNGEIGPFYGHALPYEILGPWRSANANAPF
jgi:hypothetical protein